MYLYIFSTVLLSSFALAVIAASVLHLNIAEFFWPLNLLYAFAVWAILESLVLVIRVAGLCCLRELVGVRDKMPVFLTLLRLP